MPSNNPTRNRNRNRNRPGSIRRKSDLIPTRAQVLAALDQAIDTLRNSIVPGVRAPEHDQYRHEIRCLNRARTLVHIHANPKPSVPPCLCGSSPSQ